MLRSVRPDGRLDEGKSVSADVGLTTFARFSDGICIANPSFFREEGKALTKAQRHPSSFNEPSIHDSRFNNFVVGDFRIRFLDQAERRKTSQGECNSDGEKTSSHSHVIPPACKAASSYLKKSFRVMGVLDRSTGFQRSIDIYIKNKTASSVFGKICMEKPPFYRHNFPDANVSCSSSRA